MRSQVIGSHHVSSHMSRSPQATRKLELRLGADVQSTLRMKSSSTAKTKCILAVFSHPSPTSFLFFTVQLSLGHVMTFCVWVLPLFSTFFVLSPVYGELPLLCTVSQICPSPFHLTQQILRPFLPLSVLAQINARSSV